MFDETRVYFCCAKVCGLLNDFLAIFSANRVVEVVWTSIRWGGDCHDQEERGIIMTDVRRKASMSQVLADIKPYITKKFMATPYIKEQDIQAICQILLPRYKNVQLMQGLTNNKPDFRIQVKGLFGTEEKRFEVVGGDKKRPATKKKSDLGWIDRLEEIDAALDDF